MVLESRMRNNPYQNYLEDEVLTADPIKLIVLLYRGGIDSVSSARRHLAAGDIRARSRSITKAMEIVGELAGALDYERGGDVSKELARVYEYVLRALTEANVKQIDEPLAQSEALLSTLLTAWQGVQSKETPGASEHAVPDMPVSSNRHEQSEAGMPRVSYAY